MSAVQGFFAIDRRWWRQICGDYDINMAVSYLTVAAGTGRGNRLSSWSATAIEKYTGLSWQRASVSIKKLIGIGYIRLREDSARCKPRYELTSYDDDDRTPGREELIWLPNALIMGTVSGEASPVRRLRSRGDLAALRLLIDLYQAQHLSADGGIGRAVLRREYRRQKCGERGRQVVWGFTETVGVAEMSHASTEAFRHGHAAPGAKEHPLWSAICVLRSEGLLTIVPHLVENASLDSEPIHGFGWDGVGEPLEQELGRAADEAGRYIIGDVRVCVAEKAGVQIFAPAWDTQEDVQMVGVFRLTYRPQTKRTADWYRRLDLQAMEWMEIYRRIGPLGHALRLVSGL
jgi:hypothetical protein